MLLGIGLISRILGRNARTAFGRLLGNIMIYLSSKRRRITYENIRNAFPDQSDLWCREITVQSYHNLGIVLAELLAMPSFDREDFDKYIKYSNISLLSEVFNRGRGLILLSGHFGNWELLAHSAGLFTGIPITIIVKPQRNRHADDLLNKYRTLHGNRIVSMYKAARAIIQELSRHNAIALLADQSATRDRDVFVDFFGRPASTFEAPAALALRFRTPIVMGFAVRQPDNSYRVDLREIKFDDLENNSDGVRELTRRHVAELESEIRKNPGLWAWQHRRWKHEAPKKVKNA
ncbi:MAG: lysophospholipid acyltransferase family protein [Candidatus Kapaibacterium sp.]